MIENLHSRFVGELGVKYLKPISQDGVVQITADLYKKSPSGDFLFAYNYHCRS